MIRLDELGEREIEGLRPDMVLVGAAASRREICNYTGRLMRVLGSPAAVLPTHWDIYFVPFDAPQDTALARLADFVREVHAGSPTAPVIIPKYFDPIVIPPTGGYEMRPLGFAVAILISVAACSPPRPLEHPRPQYPDMLSAAKLGGTVIARLNVDRRGRVRSITVDSATHAHALFRVSARNALRSARFHPARWFGIAHPGSFRYSIQYVLAERGPAGSASPARSSVDSLAGCPHARSDSDLVVCAVPVVRRADIQ